MYGVQDEEYRSRWEGAMDEAMKVLVGTSAEGSTRWLGEMRRAGGILDRKFDHLACYFPGNIALGVQQGAVGPDKAPYYMAVAANLTRTCWRMYDDMPTGDNMLPSFLGHIHVQVRSAVSLEVQMLLLTKYTSKSIGNLDRYRGTSCTEVTMRAARTVLSVMSHRRAWISSHLPYMARFLTGSCAWLLQPH